MKNQNTQQSRNGATKISGFLALLLMATFVSRCKPLNTDDASSDSASVDNFADSNGRLTLNQCRRDQDSRGVYAAPIDNNLSKKNDVIKEWINASGVYSMRDGTGNVVSSWVPSKDPSILAALTDVYQVVPVAIGSGFFAGASNQKRPQIRLNQGASNKCKDEVFRSLSPVEQQQVKDSGIAEVFVCHYVEAGVPVIEFGQGKYVDGSGAMQTVDVAAAIRHAMLSELVNFYAERLNGATQAGLLLANDSSASAMNAFESRKEMAVAGFRKDLQNFSADVAQKMGAIPDEQLKERLFVESMDSIYCSASTNELFKNCFPQTYAAFMGAVPTASGSASSCPLYRSSSANK